MVNQEKITQIEKLINNKLYNDALEMCTDNDIEIKRLKMRILINSKDIDAAKELLKDPDLINDVQANLSLVSYLNYHNRFDDAMKIASRKEFCDDELMASQHIKSLVKKKQYKDALKIASKEQFIHMPNIQAQRVNILLILGMKEDAINICRNEEFANSYPVQYVYAKCLYEAHKYDKASQICNKFPSEQMHRLLIDCYFKLGKVNEAVEIMKLPEFENNGKIQKSLANFKKPDIKYNVEKQVTNDPNVIAKSKLLTSIYSGNISINDILNSNISKWDKDILMLAYYDKFNKSLVAKYLKELKKKYGSDMDKIKTLNIIASSANQNYFNANKYEVALGASVNIVSQPKNIKKAHLLIRPEAPKFKKENTSVKVSPVLPKTRPSMVKSSISNYTANPVKPTFPKRESIDRTSLKIKDYFPNLCDKIFRSTYVMMQDFDIEKRSKAIIFYDNFEVFVEKSISVDTMKRFKLVLEKNFNYSIKYNESEFKKQLDKLFDSSELKEIFPDDKSNTKIIKL